MTRISNLTALGSADGGDTVPILDVSATTTKKITKSAFLSDVVDGTLLATGSIVPGKIDIEVADATALAALTEVKGMIAYQADTDMLQVYDGTDWCNIPRLLKKTTLTSAGDTITVDNIPLRENLTVKAFCKDTGGAIASSWKFNNDSGTNYAYQYSFSGAAYTSTVSSAAIPIRPVASAVGESHPSYAVIDISNSSTEHKMFHAEMHDAFGPDATFSVNFGSLSGKWASTAQMTRVDCVNIGAGSYDVGSYVEVWG